MGASIFALALQCLGISWLEILTTRRLDVDESGTGVATWSTVAKSTVGGEGSFSIVHGGHRLDSVYLFLKLWRMWRKGCVKKT